MTVAQRDPEPGRALLVGGAFVLCAFGLLAGMRPPAARAGHAASAQETAPRTASGTGTSGQATPKSTAAPRSTGAPTSTLPDPGRLPQTDVKPTSDSAIFKAHTRSLWQAIVDDNPDLARGFFFPQSAYVQIKAIADPAADWDNRLIAEFDQDVGSLHATLGADAARASFVELAVPGDQAQWIVPGVEYNSGSYWRVYGSKLRYRLDDGTLHELPVTSLISWRGEWYVVHLGPIR